MFLNVGRLFNIQFRLHYSWFITFFLVTFYLVYPDFSKWEWWLIGVITSLLFFASVLAHELAHSLVGRATGVPIGRITLFIFGGVAEMTREVSRPSVELKMAIAGPISSLIIGGVFGLLWFFITNMPEPVAAMIQGLAVTNVALAVFNLVPGFPLDGGRVLRSILWKATGSYFRSTHIATWVALAVCSIFVVGGVYIIFIRPFGLSWFDGGWIIFLAWFLASTTLANYRELRRQETIRRFTVSGSMS